NRHQVPKKCSYLLPTLAQGKGIVAGKCPRLDRFAKSDGNQGKRKRRPRQKNCPGVEAGAIAAHGLNPAYWLEQQPPLVFAACSTGRAFLAASPATWVVWLPLGICMVVSCLSNGIEYFFSIFSRYTGPEL